MRRGFLSVALVGLLAGPSAFGQGSDAALKDRVSQLVGRLGSDKAEERDAAEKSLVGLGPRVLPFLDDAGKAGSDDRKARVGKVREALLESQAKASLTASRVTIQGKGIRLTEAIKKLQGDTGNTINDVREQQGVDVTNPALDLDIVDKPFFEALDIVADKAGLTLEFASGDGSIGLTAGMPEGATAMPRAKPMVVYNGPFRVVLKQLGSVRDFSTGTGSMTAQFEVAWEPRLRPMLLAAKADQFQIVTDDDRPVPPTVSEESTDVPLRPENPSIEMNINLISPDRISRELKSIKIKAEVTVPSGLKTFKFKNIEDKDVVIKEGDIAVKLESTTVEEQVWKVAISAEYPGGGPAFESYRQGLFNNRIWLQKADGSRFEHNGGLNDNGGGGGKLGFEYLFVDVPGKLSDYGLVYETPSKVLTIPLEFEFKKVPLP